MKQLDGKEKFRHYREGKIVLMASLESSARVEDQEVHICYSRLIGPFPGIITHGVA